MIKIKIDKSLSLDFISRILNIYMGNSVIVSKDVGEYFNIDEPLGKENYAYIRYENINPENERSTESLLVNDKGEFLLALKDIAQNDHYLIIKEVSFEYLEGYPVKEIIFCNRDSFTASNAENIINCVGGQLLIDDKVIYEKSIKSAMLTSNENMNNDEVYYKKNNKIKDLLKNDIKGFFKEGLGKYAYLNDTDEALNLVSSIYKDLINGEINKVITKEKKKIGR